VPLCDLGAGGRSRRDVRGVPSRPPEPQLECPDSCALSKGEGILKLYLHVCAAYTVTVQ